MSKSVKILCVEDNIKNMRLINKMLRSEGYQIIEAFDGLSGVRLAKEHHPTLILMDINLPDIDGMEATRRIKATDSLEGTPIIALTANAMYGDRERFLDAGCDAYIAKPIIRNELLNIIARFIADPNRA